MKVMLQRFSQLKNPRLYLSPPWRRFYYERLHSRGFHIRLIGHALPLRRRQLSISYHIRTISPSDDQSSLARRKCKPIDMDGRARSDVLEFSTGLTFLLHWRSCTQPRWRKFSVSISPAYFVVAVLVIVSDGAVTLNVIDAVVLRRVWKEWTRCHGGNLRSAT